MRKTALALLMLTSLLVCCLIAGTPVNNDVSREATTAGIHLTPPPSPARTAPAAASTALAVITVALVLLSTRRLDVTSARPVDAVDGGRSLLRAWTAPRRGPPAPAV